MKYEVIDSQVEAVPVVLAGTKLMAVVIGGRAHLVDDAIFAALFHEAQNGSGQAPKRGRSHPRKTVESAPPAKANGKAKKLRLADYPAELQHPLAVKSRLVYDALKSGPKTLRQVSDAVNQVAENEFALPLISSALFNLSQKGLVKTPERAGEAWELV